jgi:hypothetical protein
MKVVTANTNESKLKCNKLKLPKHVELIGIINKPLLLHLVGCLNYFYEILFI